MRSDEIRELLELAVFRKDSVHHPEVPPDFDSLEVRIADRFPSETTLRFPSAVRSIYQWSFTGAQVGPVCFIDAPIGEPLQQLGRRIFDWYDPSAIAGNGLLVIADDGNDGGPLCLRAVSGTSPEEWGIWLWDHDHRAPTDRLFSSTDKMIEVLLAIANGQTVRDAAVLDPGTDLASAYGWWDDE